MKTLLESLKPEILKAIDLEIDLYPTMIANVKAELECNYSWLSLTVNTASHICTYGKFNLSISELSNCFTE